MLLADYIDQKKAGRLIKALIAAGPEQWKLGSGGTFVAIFGRTSFMLHETLGKNPRSCALALTIDPLMKGPVRLHGGSLDKTDAPTELVAFYRRLVDASEDARLAKECGRAQCAVDAALEEFN